MNSRQFKATSRGVTQRLRASRADFADQAELVFVRDGYSCVRCGRRGSQRHHRVPRGMGGASRSTSAHNPSRQISVCLDCHEWIESHREIATELGYLVPMGQYSEEWPIFWRRQWVLLTDTGLVIGTTAPEGVLTP